MLSRLAGRAAAAVTRRAATASGLRGVGAVAVRAGAVAHLHAGARARAIASLAAATTGRAAARTATRPAVAAAAGPCAAERTLASSAAAAAPAPATGVVAQIALWADAYRRHGHRLASLDPLGRSTRHTRAAGDVFDPARYGLDVNSSDAYDVSAVVPGFGDRALTVRELDALFADTYGADIGLDVDHVRSDEERAFFYRAMESIPGTARRVDATFSPADKRNIHSMLVQSEVFDKFLGVKFGSFKRYALEGAEAMLPALEQLFAAASRHGVKDVVLGMPHRGRFNVLVSLLGYPSRAFFAKIKGQSHIPSAYVGDCDVASHIAASVTRKFDKANDLRVTLLHNPSHLEAVNPVSQGKTRAKMDDNSDPRADRTLNIQLHGDAAFAGQGVVPEGLMLSQLPSFQCGGTVHMIVNNQVGFTTTYENGRSNLYSSDIVKMIDCPVLHVNGENPEAVVWACCVATDYRMRFRKDVMIDLIAYRRHGHNEVDEPSFTQPQMYANIRARKTVVEQYTAKLKAENLLSDAAVQKLTAKLQAHLEDELAAVPKWSPSAADFFQGKWKGYGQPTTMNDAVETGVAVADLQSIGLASVALPSSFALHPRLLRSHVEPRQKRMAPGYSGAAGTADGLDWATAEALAFGSLQRDGYNIRITGQDVQRGTFSQRHCHLIDQNSGQPYVPFQNAGYAGKFQAVNSNLSEFGVMCFEYGYNIHSPKTLNIWEAQFGDFFNGAQITIDTFVSSSETKWLRSNGLVLLLPHGFDGAGPEHSSCRIERFLQLCDGDALSDREVPVNMTVANPTTPANYFHLLRRQMLRKFRRPLVVASPKVLLRHPHATSALQEMAPGTRFRSVLPDVELPADAAAEVKTIAICSGKVYFDLTSERENQKRRDVAIVRVEELSPFPFSALTAELKRIAGASKQTIANVVWVQEEPQNAGAWSFVAPRLQQQVLPKAGLGADKATFTYVGRPALPLPAVGSGVAHKRQADAVVKGLFAIGK